MMKSFTSSSTNATAMTAGQEAAKKISEQLSAPKLVFAYASVSYNLSKLMVGIQGELPGVPVIGNTSFTGVITPEGFIGGDSPFLGMMAVEDEALIIGVAGLQKTGTARETGRAAAIEALKSAGKNCAPDYFYMVAPPGEEEFYLKGISEVIGRVPFFGGSAADNSISGEWSLYTDKGVFADGVAIAFFYSDKKIVNQFTGAYRETDDFGIITKVDNHRTLVEIDGVPALKKYADWCGVEPDNLKGDVLLSATITSPLGVKDRLGDLVAIRHPMNGNEDYSMAVGANVAEKTAVIRMEATVDELIEAAGATLAALKKKMPGEAAAFHLVHCGGRRAGIGEQIEKVSELVRKEAGDIPFIMEFTFGEYGYEDDGNNTIGGLMLSYTGFCK